MSDFPVTITLPPHAVITPASVCSPMGGGTLAGNQFTVLTNAWTTANMACYIPFVLEVPVTVYQIGVENGATLGGAFDVGIYDNGGNKKVSSGSVTQAGASAIQLANITDTPLDPGRYYMAMSTNSTTATYRSSVFARHFRTCGCQQQGTAFVLPATATFAALTTAVVPFMSLSLDAVI